jgi:TRAP-type C4-dicarboxylate transport system permease small subunit
LRRILRWIIGLPIAIVVIAFAIANRQWTRLSLDPFSSTSPFLSIDMPLWVLFIGGVFIGILVGWVGSWLAQGKYRKLAKDRAREITLLQSELETAKSAPSEQAVTPYIGFMP